MVEGSSELNCYAVWVGGAYSLPPVNHTDSSQSGELMYVAESG